MKPNLSFGASTLYDTQQVYVESGLEIGSVGFSNGRSYVWCSHAGSGVLVRGEPLSASEPVVSAHNLATTTACLNVGMTSITGITAGVDAIAAGAFNDGLLVVVDGGGEGNAYVIHKNFAFTAATADGEVVLRDGVAVASDSSTEVSFIANKYVNPQQSKSTLRTSFVGVPNVTVPAGNTTTQYFWAQRNGYCPTFVEGTPERGAGVRVSDRLYGRLAAAKTEIAVAGATVAGGRTVHAIGQSPFVGYMVSDAIDGEVQVVDLQNSLV